MKTTSTYEIEQYELHTMKYRVEAATEAEAITKLFQGEGRSGVTIVWSTSKWPKTSACPPMNTRSLLKPCKSWACR